MKLAVVPVEEIDQKSSFEFDRVAYQAGCRFKVDGAYGPSENCFGNLTKEQVEVMAGYLKNELLIEIDNHVYLTDDEAFSCARAMAESIGIEVE